jgi:hypothetical protein
LPHNIIIFNWLSSANELFLILTIIAYIRMQVPGVLILVNDNITTATLGTLATSVDPDPSTIQGIDTQLDITETITFEEFNARIDVDPNYPKIIHLNRLRVLVISKNFQDKRNRQLFDIVMFIKQGITSVEKCKYGAPGFSIDTQRINIFNLLYGIRRSNNTCSPCLPCFPDFPECPPKFEHNHDGYHRDNKEQTYQLHNYHHPAIPPEDRAPIYPIELSNILPNPPTPLSPCPQDIIPIEPECFPTFPPPICPPQLQTPENPRPPEHGANFRPEGLGALELWGVEALELHQRREESVFGGYKRNCCNCNCCCRGYEIIFQSDHSGCHCGCGCGCTCKEEIFFKAGHTNTPDCDCGCRGDDFF